jgi:hypothetical protein
MIDRCLLEEILTLQGLSQKVVELFLFFLGTQLLINERLEILLLLTELEDEFAELELKRRKVYLILLLGLPPLEEELYFWEDSQLHPTHQGLHIRCDFQESIFVFSLLLKRFALDMMVESSAAKRKRKAKELQQSEYQIKNLLSDLCLVEIVHDLPEVVFVLQEFFAVFIDSQKQ